MLVNTPISVGELVDKITILQIKQMHIHDRDKRAHVDHELTELMQVMSLHSIETPSVLALMTQLKKVNELLWDIEDRIRLCEKKADFSDTFIALARDVYKTNDQRAKLKRDINALTGSALCEVKSYEAY